MHRTLRWITLLLGLAAPAAAQSVKVTGQARADTTATAVATVKPPAGVYTRTRVRWQACLQVDATTASWRCSQQTGPWIPAPVAPPPPPPTPVPPPPPPVPPPAPVPPPPPPPAPSSGTKVVAVDFEAFATSGQLLAAAQAPGSPFTLGDYFGGLQGTLGPQWRELTFSLQRDPILGNVVRMRQVGTDSACPPYCTRNLTSSGPTGNVNAPLGRVVNPYWSTRTGRFLPGWTPEGNVGQSKQYKLTADTYANGQRSHRIVIGTGLFAPDFHVSGAARVLWQHRTSSFGNAIQALKFPVTAGAMEAEPWRMTTYYRYVNDTSVVAGMWVQWGTGPLYGWLAEFAQPAGSTPYPKGMMAFRNGENMNAGVDRTQYLDWGPFAVWEGGDPWGHLARAGLRP